MNIEILSVKVSTVPTQKGSYQVAEVAFKNLSFQGKVEGKKIMSFGATKGAFDVLATAQPGDAYSVTIVKNDKGYNDWVSLSKGASASPASATSSVTTSTGAGNVSPRSTYETPEERAKKQIYIVRQSSLSNAVDALTPGAKAPLKGSDVIDLAKEFEAFVFGTSSNDSAPSATAEQALLAMEDSVLWLRLGIS